MDLRQLEYFVTVARLGHFTRSAEHLYIGQPALSQAIRRLESELGVLLFDRSVHPIGLTAAGKALLPHAESVMASIGAIRDEFGLVGGAPSGRVTVGALAAVGPVELVIAEFDRMFPDVDIVLKEGVTSRLIQDLSMGQLDVVIATSVRPLPPNIDQAVVFSESMVLMAPPGSGFRDGLSMKDLDGVTFLLPSEGSGVRAILEPALDSAGIAWRRGPESNDVQRQRSVISQGVGVSIVPKSAMTVGTAPVEFYELADPPKREVALMWRKDIRPSSTVRAFLEVAGRRLMKYGGRDPEKSAVSSDR